MIKIRSKISRLYTVTTLIIISLIFYLFSLRPSGELSWHQRLIVALVTPPQKVVTYIGNTVSGAWKRYLYLVNAVEENERLKEMLDEQKIKLAQFDEILIENRRLRDLIGIKERYGLDVIGAKVIGHDPRGSFRVVTVDKGKKDGVTVNMAVISADGLVGRVVEVTRGISRILLITDPNNVVDVLDQRSRVRALLSGTVTGTALARDFYLSRLEYLERKSDVVDGDVIITSGLDGMYPSGIPVGTVSEAEAAPGDVFRRAKVVPFVDFARLEEVLIVKK